MHAGEKQALAWEKEGRSAGLLQSIHWAYPGPTVVLKNGLAS